MRSHLPGLLAIGICLFWVACGGGPATPGPAQYLSDAKNNLRSMDYDVALKNLDRSIKSAGDQPLGREAELVRVVLLTSMAEGNKQMGDAYAIGLKQPAAQARPAVFSKMRANYYGMSRVRLMNAMEAVMGQRGKLTAEPLALGIEFPEFSGSDPLAVAQIQSGRAVSDNDRYRAELEMVRNAMARRLAALLGAGDDVHKGHALFEKGGGQIDSRLYLVEMSDAFLRLSEIFGPRAIDDPRYRRASLDVVRENLDLALKLLENRPDKDLQGRIKKLRAECDKQLKTLPG